MDPSVVEDSGPARVIPSSHILSKNFATGDSKRLVNGSHQQTIDPDETLAGGVNPQKGALKKPLTMASAQDLVGMLDSVMCEHLEAQKQEILALFLYKDAPNGTPRGILSRSDLDAALLQQSAKTEAMVCEQLKRHRLWTLDSFKRLESKMQRDPMSPRLLSPRSSPREGRPGDPWHRMQATSNSMSQLFDAGPPPGNGLARQVSGESSAGGYSLNSQVKVGTAVDEVVIQEMDTPLQDADFASKDMTVAKRAGSLASMGRDVLGTSTMDFKHERERMDSRIKRMSAAEAKASITHSIAKRFGWAWEDTQEIWGKPNNCLVPIVESHLFSTFSMSAILLNAAWIGYATDQGIKNLLKTPSEENPASYSYVELFFTIVFAIELLVRLSAHRRWFFIGLEKRWNAFDTALVISSLLEIAGSAVNMSFLRCLRMFRLARAVRMIRVFRFFVGLRQIMGSIISCAQVLSWSSCCVVMLMYMFSITLLQISIYIANEGHASDVQHMKAHYGGLLRTMYSLLLAISNGALWEDLADDLGKVWDWFRPIFALWIIIVVYGILNVVTGVFVEKTAELKRHDRDIAIHKEMDHSRAFLEDMRCLFEMQGTRASKIDFDSFLHYLERNEIQMYLQVQGIDVSEAHELFLLLDVNQDGELSMDEFVYGCERLKGGVKGLDIIRLNERLTGLESKIVEQKDRERCTHRDTRATLSQILQEVKSSRDELFELRGEAKLNADDQINASYGDSF